MASDRAVDDAANAATRFAALSELFDSATRRYLLDRGLSAGWRCLEVGVGSGSIARWMSDRVGAAGRVLATDIDARFLDGLARDNLETRRHDVAREPLPARRFDLVHIRMVLIHLRERDDVLRRLANAVAPGGWLVCEEFDALSMPADPDGSPGEITPETQAAMTRVGADRGLDRRFGRLLFGRLRAFGFADVGAEGRLSMATAGSPMATLLEASYRLRRAEMIAGGYVTPETFDRDLALLNDDAFMMPSPIMWTAWGRRPLESECGV
ncbi:MAG TPA: methyltransferase domain-containing protein [Vicinamibacterales bacterium]|jgi:SAM-dependent methyltransferase